QRRCSKLMRVVSVAELGGAESLDSIIVLGPLRWFPAGILQSPRALAIHVLTPSFFQDRWSARLSLAGSIDQGASLAVQRMEIAKSPAPVPNEIEELVDPGAILPADEWEAAAT